MDSDPEPRSTSSSQPSAAAQGDDSPEEPPSPWSSAAIVLGPLIAALTLIVPLGSIVAERLSDGTTPGPQPELMGGWPAFRGSRAIRAEGVGVRPEAPAVIDVGGR